MVHVLVPHEPGSWMCMTLFVLHAGYIYTMQRRMLWAWGTSINFTVAYVGLSSGGAKSWQGQL